MRLDLFIASKHGISRVLARDMIEKGLVRINGNVIYKSGFKLKSEHKITVEHMEKIFVSRGGFKLQKALDEFSIDLNNAVCMDVGAAAGGFTDCMLQYGAKKVYAIDIGSAQLKNCIKTHDRVIPMENTDIRNIAPDMLDALDFICVDLSFISLDKILVNLYEFFTSSTNGIMLIKPQFEAGPGVVNKNGIIKNKKIHYKILISVYNYITRSGFGILKLCLSPLLGGDGNREFFVHIVNDSNRGLAFEEFDALARYQALE